MNKKIILFVLLIMFILINKNYGQTYAVDLEVGSVTTSNSVVAFGTSSTISVLIKNNKGTIPIGGAYVQVSVSKITFQQNVSISGYQSSSWQIHYLDSQTISFINIQPLSSNPNNYFELNIPTIATQSGNANIVVVSSLRDQSLVTDVQGNNQSKYTLLTVSQPLTFKNHEFSVKKLSCGEVLIQIPHLDVLENCFVETSLDGNNFIVKKKLQNQNRDISVKQDYHSMFYRLKFEDNNQTFYTPSKKIEMTCLENTAYKIYPNPANLYFNITGLKGSEDLFIYDAKSTLVKHYSKHNGLENVNIKDLPKGIYNIVITDNNTILYTSSLVIQ